MLEAMLLGARPNILAAPIFLFDMATQKATGPDGNLPVTTTVAGGSVVDNTYLINGKPSMSLPAATSNLVINLTTPLDLTTGPVPGEFTLEWSFIHHSGLAAGQYYGSTYFQNGAGTPGVAVYYGDTPFRDSLLHTTTPGTASDTCWILTGATKAVQQAVLIQAAIVVRGGGVYFYRNGILLRVQRYSEWIEQDFSPNRGGWNALSRITLGWYNATLKNAPSHFGNVRISNYARYKQNYTPTPF
jgi:hypothetical protein